MGKFFKRLNLMGAQVIFPLLEWLVRWKKYLFVLHFRDAAILAGAETKTGRVVVYLRKFHTPIHLRAGTTDITVFTKIFVENEYQLPFKIEPRFIVDAGANTGLASMYFALQFPNAKILGIEPETENFEWLKKNTATFENIRVLQAALWNRQTKLQLQNANAQPWAFQFGEGTAGSVPTLTIPKILQELEADQIDILKIDIEGAEFEVFDESAGEWLDKINVLIVEIHDQYRPGATARLVKHLARRSFQSLVIGESFFVCFTKEGADAPWALSKDRHG